MYVRFPGLGLEFEIGRWPFTVFGYPIYWYGIIIAFAFALAVLLALRSCRKFGIEQETILDLVLVAAPVSIVFARLYYVVFSWENYRENIINVFKIRDGGLAIYGAVIGAMLAALSYAAVKKVPFLRLADFCVPYLALGQAIGRWGNFINQEAFGTKTDLPWRMNGTNPDKYLANLDGALDLARWGVHPTFLYESLLDLVIFFFLIYFRKRKKLEGEVLFLYLALYGAGRCLIEGLRTDSLMLGSFRVSQLLSAVLVVVFASLFICGRAKMARNTDNEPVKLGESQYGPLLMRMKEEEMREKERTEQGMIPGEQEHRDENGESGEIDLREIDEGRDISESSLNAAKKREDDLGR